MGKENITKLIWLLPITCGMLGGILMYIAVKKDSQDMANDGILCGVVVTAGGIILFGVYMIVYFQKVMMLFF